MEISELQQNDEKDWEDYIKKSSDSTFYHQIGWKNIVEGIYDHKPHYLIAKEDDEIRGILPLFLMKSILFGKKLISVPFGPYGGVCADSKIIKDKLIEEAIRLSKEEGVDYLELRSITNDGSNLVEKSLQVTSILELDSEPEVTWKKIKRDKRRGIEKAKKANLKVIWDINRFDEFYKIYVHTMLNLGSPIHTITFFKKILTEFPDNSRIVIVKHEDKVIASIFLLLFKDTVISAWSGLHRNYSMFYPNNLANWEVIKKCAAEGYKFFDFGRSMPNSGVHEFKKSFGAETKYLKYQYYLNNINEIPNITVSNPKRHFFATIWKRLPVPIASSVGPILRRSFP